MLAALVASGLSAPPGGLLAGALLASNATFRWGAFNGMESGFAVFLGLCVVLALLADRTELAAIFLGLAVWNKLDATMLGLAVAFSWLAVRRTLPIKLIMLSTAVALPWFVFALWYTGSPVPNSIIAKLSDRPYRPADHLWLVHHFFYDRSLFLPSLLAPVMFAPPVWKRMTRGQRVAAATIAVWFVLHGLAFSLFWLGDYFFWYFTVLCVPPIVLGCAAASTLLQRTPELVGRRWLAVAVALAAWLWMSRPPIKGIAAQLKHGPAFSIDTFDFDRYVAGIFLDQYANPSEVVSSGYGFVAYGASRNPFNDATRLNTIKFLKPDAYWVTHGEPPFQGFNHPQAPAGFMPLASFNLCSDLLPGCSWFTVFGAPDSAIVRKGKRFLQLRLPDLTPPQPCSREYGLSGLKIVGNDMYANPPSGATFSVANQRQPVLVVFTPVVGPSRLANANPDGVVFELRAGTRVINQWHLAANSTFQQPVVVALKETETIDQTTISFITKVGVGGDTEATAEWRDVKLVIGDAYPDLSGLRSFYKPLLGAWIDHNGPPPYPRKLR